MAVVQRSQAAAACLYFACCPTELCVAAAGPGGTLPSAALEPVDLPEDPYQPLKPLDEATAPFMVGRELDTVYAASLVDDGPARLVLIHGLGKPRRLGASRRCCGPAFCLTWKTDASVIACSGPGFTDGEAPESELDYPLLTIRAASDLAGQLALALLDFCRRPLTYATPDGKDCHR